MPVRRNPVVVGRLDGMAAMYQWHNHGKAIISARSEIENVDIPRLQARFAEIQTARRAAMSLFATRVGAV